MDGFQINLRRICIQKIKILLDLKSVSEISQFEEYDQEEPSDYGIRSKKFNSTI
jgi:hypothetical protein